MATSAVETLFSISELLEAILVHLDQTTLLVAAQRVNKFWFNVISASNTLQQALFFKPIKPPVKPSLAYSHYSNAQREQSENYWSSLYGREIEASFNPLLVKHFGSSVFFNPIDDGCWRHPWDFYSELAWCDAC